MQHLDPLSPTWEAGSNRGGRDDSECGLFASHCSQSARDLLVGRASRESLIWRAESPYCGPRRDGGTLGCPIRRRLAGDLNGLAGSFEYATPGSSANIL